MRKISLLNFKGGVGKTSCATNLSYELTQRGRRVLLVDCDLQKNASSILPKERREPPTLTHVLKGQAPFAAAIREARPGLDVLPSDSGLNEAAKSVVAGGAAGYYLLSNAVEEISGYDFLFFDHSPSYGPVTECGLLASDEVLIPVEMAPFAMQGLVDMVNKLAADMRALRHTLKIAGIVPFKLDQRSAMTPEYMEELIKQWGERVAPPIRIDETIKKAQTAGLTVFEYDAKCRTCEDFRALASALLREEVTADATKA